MKIIFFLIATSLLLALGFLAAFFWAVRGGQYEDEYTPSVRILFDDKMGEINPAQRTEKQPTIKVKGECDSPQPITTNQL